MNIMCYQTTHCPEIRQALVIEPDTRELDEETVPDEDIVNSVCAGLVKRPTTFA